MFFGFYVSHRWHPSSSFLCLFGAYVLRADFMVWFLLPVLSWWRWSNSSHNSSNESWLTFCNLRKITSFTILSLYKPNRSFDDLLFIFAFTLSLKFGLILLANWMDVGMFFIFISKSILLESNFFSMNTIFINDIHLFKGLIFLLAFFNRKAAMF